MNFLTRYSVYAGLAGVVALLNGLLVTKRNPQAGAPISYVLDIVMVVLAIVVGRSAKVERRRPLWSGAVVGAVYGFIGSLNTFFTKVDTTLFKQANLTANQAKHYADTLNSPGVHIAAVIGATLFFGVVGLIFGAIGGASVKRREE